MYRTKFLPVFANCTYGIGVQSPPLAVDSPLVGRVGRAIAIWSHADHQLGMLLGTLVGAGAAVALELFMSLRRSNAQIRSLKTAAKAKLQADDLKICVALLAIYDELEAARNDLAHGVFGDCGADNKAFAWIAQGDYVHFNTSALTTASPSHDQLKENMWVYTVEDLDRMGEDFEEFYWSIFDFNCYLRDSNGTGGQHHRTSLLGRKLIQAKLP